MRLFTVPRTLTALTVLLSLFFALPHVLNRVYEGDHAMILMMSQDDGQYDARIRAALLHRYSETRNGMIGGTPPVQGVSPAVMETTIGWLFSGTHLKAPQVITLLTILVTPLVLPLLALFFRLFAFSWGVSIAGAVVYVLVFLGALQKPVNMSISLPITILSLVCLQWLLLRRTWGWILVCGLLLALLPWIYFWSWTYVWSVCLWVCVLGLVFGVKTARQQTFFATLGWTAAVTVVGAIPFFLDLHHLSQLPAFIETSVRSTIIHSRGVESVPRFLLLLSLTVFTALLVRVSFRRQQTHWLFPFAMLLGIDCAMYQNFVHGVIFSFSSHFYPFVCLSALTILLWALYQAPRSWLRYPVILCASVFLIAGFWDYRFVWSYAVRGYYLHPFQHLKPALALLDDGKRQTILTDHTSGLMVASWTDDDALFTPYVRHLLVTDAEYAERYCLSELPNPDGPDILWLAKEVVEQQSHTDEIKARQKQFAAVCDPIRTNPVPYLQKYHVTTVLWNELFRPNWRLDPHLFTQTASGSGWSLWSVRQ